MGLHSLCTNKHLNIRAHRGALYRNGSELDATRSGPFHLATIAIRKKIMIKLEYYNQTITVKHHEVI